jgi:hypothetical protein
METAHARMTERNLSGYGNSTVRASDAVKVEGVTATIRAQGGAVLEEGAGVWSSASASWAYTGLHGHDEPDPRSGGVDRSQRHRVAGAQDHQVPREPKRNLKSEISNLKPKFRTLKSAEQE